MRKLFVLAILLTSLLAAPAFAQTGEPTAAPPTVEATAEPTPAPDVPPVDPAPDGNSELLSILLPWVGAIIIILIIGFTIVARAAIVEGAKQAPAFVVDAAVSALTTLFDRAGEYVRDTPNTVDDESLAELRRRFDELVAEIRAGRG